MKANKENKKRSQVKTKQKNKKQKETTAISFQLLTFPIL